MAKQVNLVRKVLLVMRDKPRHRLAPLVPRVATARMVPLVRRVKQLLENKQISSWKLHENFKFYETIFL
jgi:protein gp37